MSEIKKLKSALKKLVEKDSYLLQIDANERTRTHRLAIYLEEDEFDDWNVDCEYNRMNHDLSKKLSISKERNTTEDTNAKTVFPDIIIHKRGNNENNLMVLEVKKSTNADEKLLDYDKEKLEAFKEELNYEYCISLIINTKNDFNENRKNYDLKMLE